MLIQGTAKWAKVTGEPVWGYENKFKEWSLDVYVDADTVKKLEAEGLKKKIKDKGNGKYITFKRKELKADGSPNQPIRIVDAHGETLQDKDTKYTGGKIGNGSVVNVNFVTNEYKPGEVNANILSLQIWELVKYEGGEFPTKEDGEGNWEKDAA